MALHYKGIAGKSCKFGNVEATAVSDGSATVIHMMINDTPFTLSEETTGQLIDVLAAVTEWRPAEETDR